MMPVANVFNILALVSVAITAMLHWYGVEMSLYWTTPWWDVLAHFFGGLTVGAWAVAVAIKMHLSPRTAAWWIFGLILVVGVSWEIWEAVEGLGGGSLDTLKDIADDVLGTIAAWLIYKLLYKRS